MTGIVLFCLSREAGEKRIVITLCFHNAYIIYKVLPTCALPGPPLGLGRPRSQHLHFTDEKMEMQRRLVTSRRSVAGG